MAPKRGFVADSDDDEDFDDTEQPVAVDVDVDVDVVSPPRRAAMAVMDVYEPLPQQPAQQVTHHHQQQQQQQERFATPETEPLSPAHRPAYEARPGSSDSTSKSAFASIYQAHAQLQLQGQHQQEKQSRLIENIVRQSQRVVSSGPGGSGSGEDAGENSTISHPVSFGRINAGDSMVVSDRDEGPVLDEWDIPSSPEAGASATTHAARNRRRSRGGDGNAGSGGGAAAGGSSPPWDQEPTLPSLSTAAKRSRVSLHDTATDSAGKIGVGGGGGVNNGFYVAPSNMTTMQKLEYHRVSMPQMSTSEVLPALPLGGVVGGTPRMSTTQKSSGATTIAYTTPSRYASSGRPYPWEESLVVEEGGIEGNVDGDVNIDGEVAMIGYGDDEIGMQLEADQQVFAEPKPTLPAPEIIHISSSPDIIADERPSSRRRKRADTSAVADESAQDSPSRSSTKPSAKKRKSRQVSYKEDADELAGHEDLWAFQDEDTPVESYKPRPSLRRSKAVTPRKEEAAKELDEPQASLDKDELAPTQDPEPRPAKKSRRQIQDSDDEEDFVEQEPEHEEPEPEPAPVPKKRGRKKKEKPAPEVTMEDLAAENAERPPQVEDHHNEAPAGVPADEISEAPKKRGRKKKAATPASVPVEDLTAEAEEDQPHGEDAYVEPPAAESLEEEQNPPKKKRGRPKKADKAKESKAAEAQVEEPVPPARVEVEEDESVVAEAAISKAKSRSPSPKRSPLETKDPNAAMSPKKDHKQESTKVVEKKDANPTTKPGSALSTPVNARYRVGLSKKSRIAPLLKIIRK